MADFANLQQKGAVPESTAQLIDVLFETTSCLKSQLEANRKTTTILLERANQLKTQILDHNVPEKRDNEATTVLQLQNQELQDTVGEYKTTLDIIIDKHLTQMMGLQQLCAQQVEHVEMKLAQERERSELLRKQNVQLKETIEGMLRVMKLVAAEESADSSRFESYIDCLEGQNQAYRDALESTPSLS